MSDNPEKAKLIKTRITNPPDDFPHLYFNGFRISVGSGDIQILLERAGRIDLQLHASYTVAKTLAEALTNAIALFEDTTGHNLMTTYDVRRALDKASGESDEIT